MPGFLGELQNVDGFGEVAGESVNSVGVVPHDTEIGCGRVECRKLFACLPRIANPRGVAEDGHGPHALDLRIFEKLGHGVEVRPLIRHRDVDHLEPEVLGDGEVAVISRDRADPLNGVFVFPRPPRILGAKDVRPHDQVVHDVQAGCVPRDDVLNGNSQQVSVDFPNIDDAAQTTVVATIGAIVGGVVARAGKAEQFIAEVQLFRGRLAAGQVQREVLGLEFVVCLLDVGFGAGERFDVNFRRCDLR